MMRPRPHSELAHRLGETAGRAGMLLIFTAGFFVGVGLLTALLALEFFEFGAFILRGMRDVESDRY